MGRYCSKDGVGEKDCRLPNEKAPARFPFGIWQSAFGISFRVSSPYTPAVPIDFSPYQAVLLDLDGTVYHESQALPGAMPLIRRLQEQRKNYACLSNSTSSPMRVTMRLAVMIRNVVRLG